MKQYILVRTDKKFPVGKIMAHCSHNAVKNFKKEMYYEDLGFRHTEWFYNNDMTTIVLDGKSLVDIERILKQAEDMKIPTSFIEDIHLKQKICAVVGPVDNEEAKVLGLSKLRLYK